jgi:CHAT domain-containing protein/tetratricopeptide (TPR) repeat protein
MIVLLSTWAVLGSPPDASAIEAHNRNTVALINAGDYAAALPECEALVRLAKQSRAPNHPDVGIALKNLGYVRFQLSDYPRAYEELTEAVRILETHPECETSTTLARGLLSGVCLKQDKFQEAERQLNAALASIHARLGPDHLELAEVYDGLGRAAAGRGDWPAAGERFTRALALREKHLPQESPAIGDSLYKLANAKKSAGQYADALEYYRRAADVFERQENFLLVRMNAAAYAAYLAKINSSTDKKATIRVPRSTTELEDAWHQLSKLNEREGRFREAATWADRGRRYHRAKCTLFGFDLSDGKSEVLIDDAHAVDCMSLALKAANDPVVVALAASWAVNSKGALAEIQIANLRRLKSEPEARSLLAELTGLRRDIAHVALFGSDDADVAKLTNLRARLRSREASLDSFGFAPALNDPAFDWVELEEVRRALRPDEVYIEIRRVGGRASQHYAAWLIPPKGKGEVRAFDLGDADMLDALAEAVRRSVQDAPKEVVRIGEPEAVQKLDKLLAVAARRLLKPIEAVAGGYERWIVSPDGDLWLLPWAALPTGDGGYLAERRVLRFAVSGRDLVAPTPSVIRKAQEPLVSGPPLVLADPDFDARADGSTPVTHTPSLSFRRLPGTAAEAAAVGPKLAAWANADPRVLLGPEATETAFKSAVRPRVLLLSTHGFLVTGERGAGTARGLIFQKRGPSKANPKGDEAQPSVSLGPPIDPLLHCGLALAGANRRPAADQDDGLLTGYEIVGADLRGTELVVLSACETGLGSAHAGRGVASLRQSFHLAGARSVVASLWQVPDRETAQQMVAFFGRLAEGSTPDSALAEAQRVMIRRRRASHGAAHPFFWAAFSISVAGGAADSGPKDPLRQVTDQGPPKGEPVRPAGTSTRPTSLGVRDHGSFFGADAVRTAERATAEIKAASGKEVIVETFAAVPDEDRVRFNQLVDRAEQDKFVADWANRRAQELKVNGVYLLMCRKPGKFYVMSKGGGVARETIDRVKQQLLESFRKGDFDGGLAIAVGTLRADLAPARPQGQSEGSNPN